jgi:peptidoglycan-associated lipoprotein
MKKSTVVTCAMLFLLPLAGCARTTATTSGMGDGSASVSGRDDGSSVVRTSTERPALQEYSESMNLKDVHFDFDQYEIRPADAKMLDANARYLNSHKSELVLIEGHCDERGTPAYNLALGERRAKATMNYLVARGVSASRITVVTYGEERPVCTDHNEACWTKNRRAHFLVKTQ